MRPPGIAIIAPLELRGKASYNSRTMRRFIALAILAILAAALPLRAENAASNTITVEVVGLRNNNGVEGCALFNSADGFPDKTDKAIKTVNGKIESQRAVCVFSDVAPGDYAISTFHDENSDGKIARNFIGMPKEGVGASNDAKGSFGPPKYDDARFNYPGGAKSMTIHIRYLL
jgi:uncharacterized protein (DUF2141 family)